MNQYDLENKTEIDKKTMETHMEEKYEEIKGTVNLKGFRPGKVPREILKRQFGKAVFNEVLDKSISNYWMYCYLIRHC